MIRKREKSAAILLENTQSPRTSKSQTTSIAKLSLLVKCLKYSILHQAQEIQFLSQNANLNEAIQKLTHMVNYATHTLKELLSGYTHYFQPV